MDSIYNLPEDIEITLQREGNLIYFGITDKRWFNHIFNSNKIGISVDVVTKKDFSCQDSSTLKRDVKGVFSKPIYKKTFLKTTSHQTKTSFTPPVFTLTLPLQDNNELEINLLILNKTELCRYIVFCSHQGNKFDILDMNLYSDSLSLSNSDLDSTINHSHELTFKKNTFLHHTF